MNDIPLKECGIQEKPNVQEENSYAITEKTQICNIT